VLDGWEVAIDATLSEPGRVWALVPVAAGLGGFESLAEEDDWWEDAMAPAHEAYEAGDMKGAQEERLRIWAPLGTDDEAGSAIRRIAFDNLHELTWTTAPRSRWSRRLRTDSTRSTHPRWS
jgi:hypothetical protein